MAAPFWIKLAASELVRYKLVDRAHIRSNYLAVKYKSGVTDRYYYAGTPTMGNFKVTKHDMKMGFDIPIERTYETDPLNRDEQIGCSHHLSINKKHFRSGSFIDGRIAIHKFVALLSRSKPTLDRYPDNSVRKWIDDLRQFDYSRMITSDSFNFYKHISRYVPWRQVLWQYFPPVLDYSPHKVARILTNAIPRKILPADTAMINRTLLYEAEGSTLNYLAYCAILSKLDTDKGIIDLHPERGYKAIACGLLGIHYIYKESNEVTMALDRDITSVLGLTCEPLGDQRADILLSDGHFENFDISEASNYLDRVNTMVAYAPRIDRLWLTAKHGPSKVIKVLCRYKQGCNFRDTAEDPDFLLVW